jgi:hypothetical protein
MNSWDSLNIGNQGVVVRHLQVFVIRDEGMVWLIYCHTGDWKASINNYSAKPWHGEKHTFLPLADITCPFGSSPLFLLYVGLSSRLVRRRHGGCVQVSCGSSLVLLLFVCKSPAVRIIWDHQREQNAPVFDWLACQCAIEIAPDHWKWCVFNGLRLSMTFEIVVFYDPHIYIWAPKWRFEYLLGHVWNQPRRIRIRRWEWWSKVAALPRVGPLGGETAGVTHVYKVASDPRLKWGITKPFRWCGTGQRASLLRNSDYGIPSEAQLI